MTTQLRTRHPDRLTLAGLLLWFVYAAPGLAGDAPNQARIHELNDEFDLAIEAYLEDIAEEEKTRGPFAMSLVEPLTGLGRSYLATGDLAEAEEVLRRAQHLTHRSQGVHSPAQLPMVDILTDKFLMEDLPLEADRQQRFALFINEHHYGKDSPEVLPALNKMADWFVQTGQYHNAREILEQMIEIMQNDGGEYDLRQLEPLEKIALTRRLQGICCSYRSLLTAREIIENNAAADDDTRMRVYLELADAYLASGKAEDAHENYREALALAGDGKDTLLATPQQIAMSETLNNQRRAFMRYYQVERDGPGPGRYNPYGQSQLRELSPEEQLLLEQQP
ncbi:MAG: tetratricopeptide repeat protein, partial [Pseudomonadales bacterium]|nr:tetratricopeptide repeat protein [Pseudomonadales bacterium]